MALRKVIKRPDSGHMCTSQLLKSRWSIDFMCRKKKKKLHFVYKSDENVGPAVVT